MHTVFINDQALRFISVLDQKELRLASNHVLYSEHDKLISDLIIQLENTKTTNEFFYLSDNADVSWKIFISHCQLIEAAGGLVRNKNEEYLIILRHHLWDLPKGKIEYDESPEQAAVREVEEECGAQQLTIARKLPTTFHTYWLNTKRMLKKNHWFLMDTVSDAPLRPQNNEGIEEAHWMNEKKIQSTVVSNTYGSISELLHVFFGWN